MKTKFHKRSLFISIMCFVIAGIALILLLTSCGGGGSQLAVLVKEDGIFTPLGFQVAIPQSIYTHGLYFETHTITDKEAIKIILLSWIDQWARYYLTLGRMISVFDNDKEEWTQRPVVLEDFVNIPIVLFDDFKFTCNAVNAPTGWCAGLLDNGIIGSAIYYEWSGLENPPPYNYPPHTLAWSTRTLKWWAGIIPDSQIGMPSLIHEWDEVFGQAVN
jgi:hypothetical protein